MNEDKSNKKKLLAIETSCDETGVCLLSAEGAYPKTSITIHANELASQVEDHQEYGGVFPSLAKRLHAKNLPVLLEKLLKDVETGPVAEISEEKRALISGWLKRHDGLADKLFSLVETYGLPKLDAIAVTVGPGLEPALWVGINVARTLALLLDIKIIPTNHMDGHLISSLAPDNIANSDTHTLKPITFPAVALLVSGGHTELIYIKDWQTYEKIGQTRDDAAGEAFDKVGRLLGLPYPAGAHVSQLAKQAREVRNSKLEISNSFSLPRPMINDESLDFSFSGLKTAAARLITDNQPLTDDQRALISHELEAAIVDVLASKTTQAITQTKAETLLVGGGVSANETLRQQLTALKQQVYISPRSLAGDNAIMIGLAASGHYDDGVDPTSDISADSRLSL